MSVETENEGAEAAVAVAAATDEAPAGMEERLSSRSELPMRIVIIGAGALGGLVPAQRPGRLLHRQPGLPEPGGIRSAGWGAAGAT